MHHMGLGRRVRADIPTQTERVRRHVTPRSVAESWKCCVHDITIDITIGVLLRNSCGQPNITKIYKMKNV